MTNSIKSWVQLTFKYRMIDLLRNHRIDPGGVLQAIIVLMYERGTEESVRKSLSLI